MRILSQENMNEKWDIPYDMAVITYSKYMEGRYRIYAQGTFAGINPNENFVQIAEYSTADKAQKAMEMLRNAYSPILVIDNVSDEHIKADIKPFITPMRVGKPNIEVLDNFYFQFPADSKIEV